MRDLVMMCTLIEQVFRREFVVTEVHLRDLGDHPLLRASYRMPPGTR